MQSKWSVIYSESALKQLKKLNKKNPQLVDKIMDYLDGVAMLETLEIEAKH